MRWVGPVSWAGSSGWNEFYPTFSWNLYLTSFKKFVMLLERDFNDVVLSGFFLFLTWNYNTSYNPIFSMKLQESCSYSILLYKIIYFVTSWNFACMVELEKYTVRKMKKFIKKPGGFWGPFIRTIFYYFF